MYFTVDFKCIEHWTLKEHSNFNHETLLKRSNIENDLTERLFESTLGVNAFKSIAVLGGFICKFYLPWKKQNNLMTVVIKQIIVRIFFLLIPFYVQDRQYVVKNWIVLVLSSWSISNLHQIIRYTYKFFIC